MKGTLAQLPRNRITRLMDQVEHTRRSKRESAIRNQEKFKIENMGYEDFAHFLVLVLPQNVEDVALSSVPLLAQKAGLKIQQEVPPAFPYGARALVHAEAYFCKDQL
eukprot:1159131-Pelagomonas_calceolata.AAC.11